MRWGGSIGSFIAVGGMLTAVPLGCSAARSVVRDGVVSFATGDWTCEIDATYSEVVDPEMAEAWGELDVDATVTADSDDHGEVSFRITADGFGPGIEHVGSWRLDGTELLVEIPDPLTSYAMAGVELSTDEIEIQEGAEGAELQRVDVERDGDAVDFSWEDPWTGDPWSMTCTKV